MLTKVRFFFVSWHECRKKVVQKKRIPPPSGMEYPLFFLWFPDVAFSPVISLSFQRDAFECHIYCSIHSLIAVRIEMAAFVEGQ